MNKTIQDARNKIQTSVWADALSAGEINDLTKTLTTIDKQAREEEGKKLATMLLEVIESERKITDSRRMTDFITAISGKLQAYLQPLNNKDHE